MPNGVLVSALKVLTFASNFEKRLQYYCPVNKKKLEYLKINQKVFHLQETHITKCTDANLRVNVTYGP